MEGSQKNNDDTNKEVAHKNDSSKKIFHVIHERQSRQLCAVHAVNNLLQLSKEEGEMEAESIHSDALNSDAEDETKERNNGINDQLARCILVCANQQQDGKDGEEKSADDVQTKSNSNTRELYLDEDKKLAMKAATTEEFDSIADEMTMAEYRLLKEFDATARSSSAGSAVDDNNNGGAGIKSEQEKNKSQEQLSYLQVLRSNHRTPMLGNYSFEVMETCLKRRGVELSWYRSSSESLKNDNDEILENEKLTPIENKDGSSGEQKEGMVEGITIGFVVNSNSDNASNTSFRDSAMWYLRRIPVVGGYFGGGRHWFAITRIRAVVSSGRSDYDFKHMTAATARGKYSSPWLVVDSDSDDVEEIKSDLELRQYLDEILNDGGNVFRASLTKPLMLVDR